MTNYSRSVLKSNGLRHSKNLPVKFGFSSKTVPANIVQKLPSQRCPKPLLIAFFNFSHKWPTFAFTSESGYTLGFRRRIAHKGSHTETGGRFGRGALLLPSDCFTRFGNPAWPGGRTANFAAFGSWPGGALEKRRKPSGQRCAYACRCPEGVAAPLGCVIFLQFGDVAVFSLCAQYFLNVRGGGGITTLGAFHTVRKPCVAGT